MMPKRSSREGTRAEGTSFTRLSTITGSPGVKTSGERSHSNNAQTNHLLHVFCAICILMGSPFEADHAIKRTAHGIACRVA